MVLVLSMMILIVIGHGSSICCRAVRYSRVVQHAVQSLLGIAKVCDVDNLRLMLRFTSVVAI